MTWEMLSTSMPRAAISVATRMLVACRRGSRRARPGAGSARGCPAAQPLRSRRAASCCATRLARCLVRVKTSTEPGPVPRSISISRAVFRCCATGIERVRHGFDGRGVADLHGQRIMQDLVGQVADIIGHGGREEQRLALRGQARMMRRTSGRKPMSNMRSASSSTSTSTLDRFDGASGRYGRAGGRGRPPRSPRPARSACELRVHVDAAVDRDAAQLGLLAQIARTPGGSARPARGWARRSARARGRVGRAPGAAGWAARMPRSCRCRSGPGP